MTTGTNWANAKGPKPGNPRAISQAKAINEGYAAAATPRVVHTHQKQTKTGSVKYPGWTEGKK